MDWQKNPNIFLLEQEKYLEDIELLIHKKRKRQCNNSKYTAREEIWSYHVQKGPAS